jgi:hypothetical protein
MTEDAGQEWPTIPGDRGQPVPVPSLPRAGRMSEPDRAFAIQMSDRISKASPDYMAELANALGNRWAAFTDDELPSPSAQ